MKRAVILGIIGLISLCSGVNAVDVSSGLRPRVVTAKPVQTYNPCTAPPSGLVGWWKGDGSTTDLIGGNTGTLVNGTYTNGVVGMAFSFDPDSFPWGTYTGLRIPDQPVFAITNSLTVEAWVRPRGNGYYIMSRGDNRPGFDPYGLGMQGNNVLRFQVADQFNNPAYVETTLPMYQWTHIAATLDDSTGNLSIYTNGQLAVQSQTSIRPFGELESNRSPGLGIGNVNDGFNNFPFIGDIDEIALYNRALSPDEIQAIYLAGSAGKCVPETNCEPPPASLLGWWKGDGNGKDEVSGNNGTLINARYTGGEVGPAFSFDPNSFPWGTYTGVHVADKPAYALTNSLTIEGWVRPRGDGYVIFFRGDHRPGLDPYALSMQASHTLAFQITDADGNPAMVETTLPYDVWTHVAATLDGSSGTMSIYTNGQLAAETNTDIRPFGDLLPDQSPGIGIGNVNDGGNNFPFVGDIDEIALYGSALSANEIAAIYRAGNAGKCVGPFPPRIVSSPQGQSVVAGSSAYLSVAADGSGPLSYQWVLNGSAIPDATNASLTLANLHTYQSGIYTVRITSPHGSIVSPGVTVAVTAQPVLIYRYTGTQRLTTAGQATKYNYAGEFIYLPDATNGTFVGWGNLGGKKWYWTSPFTNYLVATIRGARGQTFTLLGNAGQTVDENGRPHIWSYLHQGLNQSLSISRDARFIFPPTLSAATTHLYPNPTTGELILSETTSTFTYQESATKSANNTGQTMADLVNGLIKSLTRQGYTSQ